ncbi:alpha/beta-hydrolase [Polyplosphaeria fusca]|uniref:Alpha/beta-hydrolase n=1 Tax=Polyplosphaeria fusca TaxID=682080 RepID=A0A9P4V0B0_9PLEO|nr:alpha/beta-hydrolase [Polyplosphaeria fusca]
MSDPKITHDSATPSDDLSPISYLAKPSGVCCLEGNIHSGNPRGSFETIADVETYICKPPDGQANGHILLYFPDVWGMFPNGLLIMDGFADAGYLVLGIDYFRGDSVWKHRKHRTDTETELGFDYEAWKQKHTAFANEAVPKWVRAIRTSYGKPATKYCCVGYCFGAPYVCDELAGSTCSAGAFAHPAFLKEHHFRNLKKPLFLSCAEVDHTFDTESRNKAIEIMNEGKKEYQLQLFSGVEHGFALRGNMEDKYERWVKEQSLKRIVDWFDFWLDL